MYLAVTLGELDRWLVSASAMGSVVTVEVEREGFAAFGL